MERPRTFVGRSVAVALGALLGLATSRVEAQGVAGSGMGQGQASITTQSDVRLSLESVPGTSGARVQALGRSVSGLMPRVRQCYGQAVAARPNVHGSLRLRLDVGADGVAHTSVTDDQVHDAEVLACLQGVLGAVAVDAAQRPASVVVALELDNSAAHGGDAVAQSRAAADEVSIQHDGGVPSTTGGTGPVSFTVRGTAETSDELVREAMLVVRTQIAPLLDCRRRASRRRRSPAGTLHFTLTLTPNAALVARPGTSTVVDPQAPQCVAQALGASPRQPRVGGVVELEVQFAP